MKGFLPTCDAMTSLTYTERSDILATAIADPIVLHKTSILDNVQVYEGKPGIVFITKNEHKNDTLVRMCLHLVWTNTRQFLAGPEQYFSFLPAGNEEICLQVISQSETNCLSFPIKNLARLPFSRKLRLSSISKKI